MKKSLLFFLSVISTSVTFGQAGTLDPTFGTGGKYSFQKHNYRMAAMAKQNDDKVILAGYFRDSLNNDQGDFCIGRLKPDGSTDSTFGNNGYTTLPFSPYYELAAAGAIQADGKIILVGTSNYTGNYQISLGAVARFNPDGSIDSSFATNGKRFVDLGGATQNELYTIGLQSNGKIILGGRAGDRAAICRLNTDGSVDSSFGVNGVFVGLNNTTYRYLQNMAIQQDDKIVADNVYLNPGAVTSVFRITANGNVDSSFATNGVNALSFPSAAFPWDLKIQNDNKIVVLLGSDGASLARLLPNGSLDNSFGTGGKVTTNYAPNGIDPYNLYIQPADQKLLVSIDYLVNSNGANFDYRLLRYNTNGTLDNEFGTNGATAPIDFYSYDDVPSAIYVMNDGKIWLSGQSIGNGAAEPYYSFMRFNSCGINISTQPSNITKTEGGTATFTVGSSSPSASYQWQTETGNTWTDLTNGGQYSGVQTATLSVANLTMSNNLATYRAVGISGTCTDTSNVATLTVETGTGVQNVFALNGINIYPNPAKDFLQIEMNTLQHQGAAFSITDITGKEIKTGLLKNTVNRVQVATLAPGIYFLKIDGIGAMKFVKD